MATLRHGIAEAIEIVAHGNVNTSNIVGRKIGELRLPMGIIIGALLRGMM